MCIRDSSGVGDDSRDRFAVVVDARGGVTADKLSEAVKLLRQKGLRTTVLFLDADDRVLTHRFEESRRPHPITASTLDEAIALERANMLEIRGMADIIADTSDLNVHQLSDRLRNAFARGLPERQMQIDVTSFGFKRGVPRVVDILFDARFLPNPHWQPELRPLTGMDAPVRDYIFAQEEANEFLAKVEDLLDFVIPYYEQEGKAYLTIGVGCTGGRHRSVAIAEAIGEHLRGGDLRVSVHHRDAGLGDGNAHQH